ncbi:MFS transporter [Brevibacterium sp. HMSC08F02]|uniref:MFS transporter n=1 Tax=Brevibacterium sp. HMSC08F02 TaxID=1581140 RepID=UPI0008A2B6EB|nr:MFS transporter [Brevibacterium sp. HMSC08F02]OFT25113.1 MFS transporter [Brevibacterium sp. HMSC08F02]
MSSDSSSEELLASDYAREAEDHAADPKVVRRATAASAIGNMTEWYDYGVYAIAATYIAHHFFDALGEYQIMATMATYAISFLARPLGGFFWGPMGDKIGRKGVLAATILLMAGATTLIGLLPTYQTIGIWAPILLIVLRLVQGFSTGGEYGGAATYMAEYAPNRRRGFFGSFLEASSLTGYVIGAALMLIIQFTVTPEQMDSFGWRIPFLIALPMGFIGWYLRSKLEDTPVFNEIQEDPEEDDTSTMDRFRAVFKEYRRDVIILFALVATVNMVNYTLLTYMPSYFEAQIGMDSQTSLIVILVGELFIVLFMPIFGAASDKFGRRPLWFFTTIAVGVLAIPMFKMMSLGFGFALVGFAVLGIAYVPMLATISATFPAMFPAHVRLLGFSVTYNLSVSALGGTAGLINEAGVKATGDLLFPAYYMILACVIGLVATWFMPETAGASIHGRQQPGTVGTRVMPQSPTDKALAERRQPGQRGMTHDEMVEKAERVAEEDESSDT